MDEKGQRIWGGKPREGDDRVLKPECRGSGRKTSELLNVREAKKL